MDFQDVDLLIETMRVWERRTGELPHSLVSILETAAQQDCRLALYWHRQVLRYPRLLKAFRSYLARGEDPAADDGPPGLPVDQQVGIPQVIMPGPVLTHERMFH